MTQISLMKLDIAESFGDLVKEEELAAILLTLQGCLTSREDSKEWATNLRFIAPWDPTLPSSPVGHDDEQQPQDGSIDEDLCVCNGPTFEERQRLEDLQVTQSGDFEDCQHYVAVSWVWNNDKPPCGATDAPSKYFIQEQPVTRECTVPQHVLSRAISFAAQYQLRFIWFDKECINQKDERDKEVGVNAMDIVYNRSLYPLGILQTRFETQRELDIFIQLVEGDVIPHDNLPLLLEVLKMLDADKWFTRAWIIQESISAGREMTLLIQHAPGLDKPDTMGSIPGEIELTIFEFLNAVYFAHACLSLCDEPLDATFEAEMNATIDHLLSYVPSTTVSPVDSNFRQTCNAAQALQFLQPRQNSCTIDRVAIVGNMCNYQLRFDTNRLEELGYGFSICAFALALFNGDLSLTRSDNPGHGEALAYSWGPQLNLQLDALQHFEDDNVAVRCSPSELTESGLIISGWLWKLDTTLPLRTADSVADDHALLIWRFIQTLLKARYSDLAQTVWDFTRNKFFGQTRGRLYDDDATPSQLSDVLDPITGAWIYADSKRLQAESQFRIFFDPQERSRLADPRTIDYQTFLRHWKYKQWFLDLLKSDNVFLATLDNVSASTRSQPTAIFDAQAEIGHTSVSAVGPAPELAIFQPSTILDEPGELLVSQRQNAPVYWVVEILKDRDCATGHRVIRGTGSMCHGYYQIPDGAQPETVIWQ